MKLGTWNSATGHFGILRPLTDEEVQKHNEFTPIVIEARNRLALFRILDRNYREWKSFLNSLLCAQFKEKEDVSEELNRLVLNYLTFAYTIQEHFEVSFYQRFKKDEAKKKEYSDFLDRICSMSWPFAFALDYRGYVQHVGLAVSRNDRRVSENSITIEVVASAQTLLAESRQWKRSQLKAEMGEIDLISTLKEFHIQMLQSYAAFVAKMFFPELAPASEFYQRLTQEAKQSAPEATMVFHKADPEIIALEGGKTSINMQLLMPPNDVYGELGIKVK